MLELPVTSDPAQEFTVQLGLLNARVTLLYNSLSTIWTLSLINTVDDLALLHGVALVLGADLFAPLSSKYGSMLCVDYTSTGTEANLDNITAVVGLVWYPPEASA